MSSDFIESPRFPLSVSWGSTAAPAYNTSVAVLRSGYEVRNSIWKYPLHRYNVAAGVRGERELYDLIEFFHVVQGRRYGFRFKDRWDFKSRFFREDVTPTDQVLGTVVNGQWQFQLVKRYEKGGVSRERVIRKPVQGTVRVAVDEGSGPVEKTEGTDFTVDYTTGVVSFLSAAVPPDGSVVYAGFEFDVPCRFEADELPVSLETYKAGAVTVTVVEIRV